MAKQRASSIRPILDGTTVQPIKQSLWATAQSLVDNPLTARIVETRTIDRESLLGGHSAASECIRFGSVETPRFERPVSAGTVPESIESAPEEVRIERPFVCELRDVQLVGPNALTITPGGGIVLENALGFRRRITMGGVRCLRSGILPRRGTTDQRYDVGLSLVGPWCTNYYHWLIDYVTRLRGLPPYEDRTDRSPTVLIPPGSAEWMEEALRLAGVRDDDWARFDRDRVAVDRLVVPSLPRGISEYFNRTDLSNTYGTSPAAIRWLRSTFRSNLSAADSVDGPDRIYVSRAGASERRVRNRAVLETVLEEYGFEALRPEEYSLREQVSLFANADAVMGPTGAGMVNAVFADDVRLITLFGTDTHPVYYILGSLLGFDVGCLQCEPVGLDMRVVPDDLRSVLDDLQLD